MYVCFANKGSLDPRSIVTFGVNSKATDSAIGFFGTGLKYGIAVLLRLGMEVVIFSGSKKYEFTLQTTKIRNNEFDVVHMNGEPLAFTTELGKKWELWMAFRELYCNMLDERGTMYLSDELTPDDDTVLVAVKGRDFIDCYNNRDQYFLNPEKLGKNYGNERVAIYDTPSQYIYYKGIRVAQHRRPALFTYNIICNHELTEDRTVKSEWDTEFRIKLALGQMDDEQMVRRALMQHDGFDTFESNPPYYSPSQTFLDVVYTNRHTDKIHPDALELCRGKMGMRFYDNAICEITAREHKVLTRALELVRKIHGPITAKINITENLPAHKLAYVVQGEDVIWLNRLVIAQGANRTASTIYEEALHLYKGLHDESRNMQNFLLDTLFGIVETL